MTPSELFTRTGVALYGAEFVAPLARALNVEPSTVRKMASGKSRIPAGVWLDLAGVIQDRERDAPPLPALREAVLKAMEQPRITNVYSFTNGMTMVFDQHGKQMPDFQGPTVEVMPKIRAAGFVDEVPVGDYRPSVEE